MFLKKKLLVIQSAAALVLTETQESAGIYYITKWFRFVFGLALYTASFIHALKPIIKPGGSVCEHANVQTLHNGHATNFTLQGPW